MIALPRMTRWLLLLADILLLVGLGLHRLEGEWTESWSLILLGVAVLHLAFLWEGIARFLKS